MRFIKVIFLGASRLGKTTVHRRLTREIVDISTAGETQPQPSTGVVESGGNVFIRNFTSNTALAKPFEWVLVDSLEDEAKMILQFIHDCISGRGQEGSVPSADNRKPGSRPISTPEHDHVYAAEEDDTEVDSVPKLHHARLSTTPSVPVQHGKSLCSSRSQRGRRHQRRLNAVEIVASLYCSAKKFKGWESVKQALKEMTFLKTEDTGAWPT